MPTFKNRPRVPGIGQCSPRVRNTRKGSCLPPHIQLGVGDVSRGGRGGQRSGRGRRHRGRTHGRTRGRNRDKCGNDEKCIVEKSDLPEKMKHELISQYFRPDMPKEWKKDPNMWLSNEDIEKVLKQYEESNSDFHFLGAVPIDFSAPDIYGDKKKCLQQEFCSVNLEEERKRGIRIIGAVFNLDHHLKDGSHWVAATIDLKRNKIYYFDSYGMETPRQISRFMKSFVLQDPSLKLERNKRRFQYGTSECGTYCVYFIIRMIEGDSFESFVKRPVSDKYMLALRKKLFYKRHDF